MYSVNTTKLQKNYRIADQLLEIVFYFDGWCGGIVVILRL